MSSQRMTTSPPSPSPSTTNSSPSKPLNSSQIEAQTILNHLLSKLCSPASRYHSRYAPYIQQHPSLPETLFSAIRPQIWTVLSHRLSLDALKLVAGDLKSENQGTIYLNAILGLDKRVRIYVGQTKSLRQRVGQHLNFRYRRDNPSLHYHALQGSVYNAFGIVAVVPRGIKGMDDVGLMLNLLEMWVCLIFRTLPEQVLEEWLPGHPDVGKGRKEGKEGVFGGLNVACPLDSGSREREWVDMSGSDDPLVRDYLSVDRMKEEEVARKEVRDEKRMKKLVIEDTPEQRKRTYAEHARRFNEAAQHEIRVPQWVVLGAIATMVGIVVFSNRGGVQPRAKWR
ncbi:hypothetical protein LEMA_P055690.1 [Plenodomus lingam JN3]|uniref:GIY-YIG domain-containing protein n=1 Tax=Leptosphaeria maculans (strain JN3 / isolate v23.1.3 / race Av1-4-5-6-7-8) TaxID=985895 RepID=E4ZMJ4_LEPMJ|nr:hypothetical protein LEMA_P055690.1 [Plenodomus lingam JN3]CBX92863.1 hypothetical protein LEMA_P055690.1 [Plenodomus lingam JN3]